VVAGKEGLSVTGGGRSVVGVLGVEGGVADVLPILHCNYFLSSVAWFLFVFVMKRPCLKEKKWFCCCHPILP